MRQRPKWSKHLLLSCTVSLDAYYAQHDSKGHQLEDGKVFSVGNYVSDFSFQSYQRTFEENVFCRLKELLQRLHDDLEENGEDDEAQAAASIHQNTVMCYFYSHTARGQVQAFESHTMCLSCLMESPEHALPCGHILCTPCLRAYGSMDNGRHSMIIRGCPLEARAGLLPIPWRINLKPSSAGVRILTLDG